MQGLEATVETLEIASDPKLLERLLAASDTFDRDGLCTSLCSIEEAFAEE